MADRFWVGGTANWDGTAATKWATTSGGAGGAAIPTSSDNAFLDANSGANTVTVSSGNTGCLNLDCTGFTGTLAGSAAITVSGGITLGAGMTRTYSGVITLNGAGSFNITSNGKTFSGTLTFNNGSGTWTLQDATVTSGVIVTAGSFVTNSQTLTNASLTVSSGATFNFTGSTVTMGAGGSINVNSGATITVNTSSLITGVRIGTCSLGGKTYNDFTMTGLLGSPIDISGANTFRNLSLTGGTTAAAEVSFSANQTITGTLTLAGNLASNRLLVRTDSNSVGTARTLTAAAVSITDVDFSDITGAGTAAPFTGTRIGDCKGNSQITTTTPANKFWVSNAGNWNDTRWATSSGGGTAVNNYPLPQDTCIFDANSFSANGHTVTINDAWRIGAIDLTATDQTFTLSHTSNCAVYGSVTLDSNVTISGNGISRYVGRATQVITSVGKSWTNPHIVDSFGGTVQLADALTTANVIDISAGTLDLNGQVATVLSSTWGGSVARGIKSSVNGGKLVTTITTASNAVLASGSNLTIDRTTGTWTIEIGGNTTNIRTFSGGGFTFPGVTFTNTTVNGQLNFTGSNTFTSLAVSTPPQTILFTAGTTTTIDGTALSDFFSGTAGNLITIGSITASSHTLTRANPAFDISSNYLSISRSTATPSAPKTWFANVTSTDGGNNSGWFFTAPTEGHGANFMALLIS